MYISYEYALANPLASSFNIEGYSHAPSVLTGSELLSKTAAIEEVRNGAVARKRGSGVFALRHLLKEVPIVREIANSERLLNLVRPILGNGAFPVRAVFLDNEPPDGLWYTHWHQDLYIAVKKRVEVPEFGPWSVKSGTLHVKPRTEILSRMVSVRIHLDDCNANDGALKVLPGSQAQGVISGKALEHWTSHQKEVVVPARAGDAIIIRPLLLHASEPCTQGNRRIIHIEYAAETLPGGLEWAIG
jgi:ectoine hydroxylase-related dioxygenase (phytanoyl-CoA dioxygenase family)